MIWFLILVLLILWNRFKRAQIIMLFPLAGFVLALASSFYLDTGIYSVELDQRTSRNYNGLVYFILMLPLFSVQLAGFNRVLKWSISSSSQIIIYAILALLLLNYSLSEKPYFGNVDRIHFWENSRLPFLKSFFGSSASFIPFSLGLMYARSRNIKFIVVWIIYIIYLLLIGQKGGALIQSTVYFLYPLSTLSGFQISKRKILIAGSIAGSLVVYAAYSSYTFLNPYAFIGLDPYEAVVYRLFALQNGMTWYAVENYMFESGTFNLNDLANGMSSIMSDITGGNIDYAYTVKNGRFTNAFPGNVLKFSSILSFPIVVVVSLLVVVSFKMFRSILANNDILGAMSFNAIMLIQINITMGDWLQSMKWFILLLILYVVQQLLFYRKTNIGG